MIEITKTIFHDGETKRRVLKTVETFAEAKAEVLALGVAFIEDDEDYEDCADAILNDGSLIAIQPVGLKVKAWDEYQAAMRMKADREAALAALDAEFGIL